MSSAHTGPAAGKAVMRAVVYREFGGPEVLTWGTAAVPEPGPGEIRVRVRAAGVNPVDYKRRYGWVEQYYPTTFPAVPGLEFSGVVDALGEGAEGFAPGDEVMGWTRTGAYADYAIAGDVVAKPAALSFEQAAAVPVAAETARRVLTELGLTAGETLLLHGAAGAVGQVAVQLAAALGATVVGTASPANHAFLRRLGAVPVAYGEGLADRVRAAAPQGVDAVFDAAGHGTLRPSVELRGGTADRIVTIAATDAAEYGVPFSAAGTPSDVVRAWTAEHARLVADGRLALPVVATFPLADAAEAQRLSEGGHVRGKLVLTL